MEENKSLDPSQIAHLNPHDIPDETGLASFTQIVAPEPVPDDPSQEFEYIVTVKRGKTIDQLQDDLIRFTGNDPTVDSGIVPDREVSVADERLGSERQTHFWLTQEEAAKLRTHPDVFSVELNPKDNPFLKIEVSASSQHDFTKPAMFGSSDGNLVNYALYRCNSPTNNYGTGVGGIGTYEYQLDGTGVDVIIMDNGVQTDHPEWEDANGVSRFQEIDWYQAAGIAGTMPSTFYSVPTNGHGTHVASTVAGKTFGWAKNSRIYSMNILGAAGTTIDTTTAFDLMKLFHRNKPVDPATGLKRPTIVNASWGVSAFYMSSPSPYDPYQGHTIYTGYQLWSGSYRGAAWSGYARDTAKGMAGTAVGTYSNTTANDSTLYRTTGKSDSYDALVQDLIDEGITFVHSAGNDATKVDIPGGTDYDNWYKVINNIINGIPILSSEIYYNRPSSPHDDEAIVVGSTDVVAFDATKDKRGYYSFYGPGVDIWAPGSAIIAAWSNGETGAAYHLNSPGTPVYIACFDVGENDNAVLTIPAGFQVSGIRYAQYGVSSGSCGTYVSGNANNADATSWANANFVGQTGPQTVTVNAPAPNGTYIFGGWNVEFGDPLSGTTKRLVCEFTLTEVVAGSDPTGLTVNYENPETYRQNNSSGTSMAAPQVSGVLALFMQLNPGASPAMAKRWLINKGSVEGILYSTGLDNDYTVTTSLAGGPNKFLYNPFGKDTVETAKGGIRLKNAVVKLK